MFHRARLTCRAGIVLGLLAALAMLLSGPLYRLGLAQRLRPASSSMSRTRVPA